MQEVSIRKKLSDLSTCTPQVYNSTNKAIVYKCMACTCIMTLCTKLIKYGHLASNGITSYGILPWLLIYYTKAIVQHQCKPQHWSIHKSYSSYWEIGPFWLPFELILLYYRLVIRSTLHNRTSMWPRGIIIIHVRLLNLFAWAYNSTYYIFCYKKQDH